MAKDNKTGNEFKGNLYFVKMVKSCCAVGCANRYSKGCFYRFPEDSEKRRRWIAAVDRKNWEPNMYTWICSVHFAGGKKSNDPTSPAYVPTMFSYLKSPVKRKAEHDMARHERVKECKKRRLEAIQREEGAQALLELCTPGNADAPVVAQPSCSVMTEISMEDIASLQDRVHELTNENQMLKAAIDRQTLSEQFFKDDDNRVKFYTGLPSFTMLMALFVFVSPFVDISRTALPPFQQFLMVLMKLRLNLGNQYLAYQFGIHQSNVSRNFKKWMNVMYERLGQLVRWPEREQLMKTMPMEFRKTFRKCVIIIDCFEVFIERPTALKARAQTWSNYKHHNTVKVLIGVAPQGCISFISKGWGGRVSDQYLTEHCGILEKLLPGDLVLADRGFIVQDAAGVYCAEVKIPPFTKGKKQLSKYEVDSARQLSRVRIHVERVIGLLRQKYTILESTLPIKLIMCTPEDKCSMIDKIVTVCSALCNCCESVVPFE